MNIKDLIGNAINWRLEQFDKTQTNAFRLFAGLSDGIEGLFIDRWNDFILIALYNTELAESKTDILESILDKFPDCSVLFKIRQLNSNDSFRYERHNLKNTFECLERHLKFEIHTDPKHDYGLYLDTKAARDFLATISKGKTVLNLFAYTCPFGLVAMRAGAEGVTNIDPNKDYLAWAGKNAELNNIMFKKYPDTTQDYLKRHLRRLESGKDDPYDLIVVDPPAFLVGRGSDRVARNLWPMWMKAFSESRCKEFLFVINDRSVVRPSEINDFFSNGLEMKIAVEEVEQSPDVIGQRLKAGQDSYYINPKVYFVKERST